MWNNPPQEAWFMGYRSSTHIITPHPPPPPRQTTICQFGHGNYAFYIVNHNSNRCVWKGPIHGISEDCSTVLSSHIRVKWVYFMGILFRSLSGKKTLQGGLPLWPDSSFWFSLSQAHWHKKCNFISVWVRKCSIFNYSKKIYISSLFHIQ